MLTLTKHFRTDYRIVIAENPSPSIFHAAEELRHFLGEITGVGFPIVFDDAEPIDTEIIIGKNRHFEALQTGIDIRELGLEGVWIQTVGTSLILAGSDVRGALYAVYEFLDCYLGCRWFTAELSKIPHRPDLTIPEINHRYIPQLELRDPYNCGYSDPDFMCRNRVNSGFHGKLSRAQGGCVFYARFVHTMNELVPPEQYYDTHPEYFALQYDKNGENPTRRGGYSQPCLTNPDVLQIALKNVRKILDENPDASIMSVSQNDIHFSCQCENCRAVDREEGSPSGALLRFVNAIAEDIEKDYPNVAIDTLAYVYTRKPPRITKPRKNVIVRLCSIECCFGHPLESCSYTWMDGGGHSTFSADLEGWASISNRLHIWDYTANFAHALQPFPDFKVLKPNIQYFIRNGVTGIFEEGENCIPERGELYALRQYVLARLLWNPEQDVDQMINEFLFAYYGMAAPAVRAWFDLLHDQVKEDTHVCIYDSPHQPYLSPAFLDESDLLFDQAERMADSEVFLQRVKTLRFSIRYVRLCNTPNTDPGRKEAAEEFIRDVRAAGIGSYREGTKLEDIEPKILEGSI